MIFIPCNGTKWVPVHSLYTVEVISSVFLGVQGAAAAWPQQDQRDPHP
jgi:hypothetical protein